MKEAPPPTRKIRARARLHHQRIGRPAACWPARRGGWRGVGADRLHGVAQTWTPNTAAPITRARLVRRSRQRTRRQPLRRERLAASPGNRTRLGDRGARAAGLLHRAPPLPRSPHRLPAPAAGPPPRPHWRLTGNPRPGAKGGVAQPVGLEVPQGSRRGRRPLSAQGFVGAAVRRLPQPAPHLHHVAGRARRPPQGRPGAGPPQRHRLDDGPLHPRRPRRAGRSRLPPRRAGCRGAYHGADCRGIPATANRAGRASGPSQIFGCTH